MFQERNETPFRSGMFLFPDEQGVDTLYAVVKATFSLRGNTLALSEEQLPLVVADEYWGEPGQSSLKTLNEAHLLKPGTDVLLKGSAYAPRGKPVESCPVSVRVGPVQQVLQVFGDRKWERGVIWPAISSPEPFTRMPLTWERAFGGTHVTRQGLVMSEPRNPVGQGFRGKRNVSEMLGRTLPNVEDPRNLIKAISDQPAPVGVGPIAPAWQPRQGYAGTYDKAWQTRRAPYLPHDFRRDFFHAAPPSLCSRQPLMGGELVELSGVSAEDTHRFALPRCELSVTVYIASRPACPNMQLETVLLEPEVGRVCLTWRGAVRCSKQTLKVNEVHFRVHSLKGVAS